MNTRLSIVWTVLAFLCVACASVESATPPPGAKYVAMGSSYAAGTGLSQQAADSPAQCGQGTDNYPRQVARALNLTLVDRSCGGATTEHILTGGQFGLPAQIGAVDSATQLVTITIGGNDVRFVADLGRFSCRQQNPPAAGGRDPCAAPDFHEDEAFAALESNLRAIAQKVHERAPKARVLFVDYMTIVPGAGTCAALGMDESSAAIMRARAARLAALTAKIAREAGADLIAASMLSRDHDVCSSQPWAWGYVRRDDPLNAGAVPFHPRLVGTNAVAGAIVQRLKR